MPRIFYLLVISPVFCVSFSLPAAAVGPSFDCAKAATPIEKLICRAPQLADLDASLAKMLRERLAQDPAARATLLSAERQWVHERDRSCQTLASSSESRRAIACLADAYQKRIAALRSAAMSGAKTDLCRKIVASYQSVLAADPEAPFRKSFYPVSPLTVLADKVDSGVRVAPHVAEVAQDPGLAPQDWVRKQKPPLVFSPGLEDKLAKSDFLDRLPDTGFYAASRVEGTAYCYDSTYFVAKNGRAEAAQGPGNWDDENGAGCGVNRDFGKVGATPVAFEENYDYSPAFTSSLSVSGSNGDRFAAACTISFQFVPRFAPQGTYNQWEQSCSAPNCDALRQAALSLVETVQASPAEAEKHLLERLTPSQRADFAAMKKDGNVTGPEKISADPADLTDKSPLILPLVAGDHLYLARVGHFTIGWRFFSDWSVKIDQRNGQGISQIAELAIGMTKGRLSGVDTK